MRTVVCSVFVFVPLFVLLSVLPAARADEITLISPTAGATINPANDAFSFSVASGATIKTCDFIIDNKTAKSAQYNSIIRGNSLSFRLAVDDGAHAVSIVCYANNGTILSTDTRTFTAMSAGEDAVTVTSSGVTRGSLTYSFKFRNSQEQKPITIRNMAAGDYMEIQFTVPPTTIKKSLYLRQRSLKDGVAFATLEDQKQNIVYTLTEGQNVSITIGGSSVVLSLLGVENNRAVFIAYPRFSAPQETLVAPTEPIAPEASKEEQQPTPETLPPAPVETPSPAPSTPPVSQNAPDALPAPENKQGFFSRLISWFASIFGA